MLSIDFLKPPTPITVAGMEFMDYQNHEFYLSLVNFLNEKLVLDDKQKWAMVDDRETASTLHDMIMNRFGINLFIRPPSEAVGNMAVDSGFINPGNLLNNKNTDTFMSFGDSNIGAAMRRLNSDLLRGTVDTSKARVSGDFSKVAFTLYTNKYISSFINEKFLEKYNVTMQEALASVILHEVGHIFTGFLFINRSVIDTILPAIAIRMIIKEKAYGKERMVIVNDTLKELECPVRLKEFELDKLSEEEILIVISKSIANRDIRRTLSLGVNTRSSEIYADLFSVRMGCPKSLVAALAFVSREYITAGLSATYLGIAIGALMISIPQLAIVGSVFGLMFGMLSADMYINPNDTYDSNYRRLKNILRDQIVRLNSDKNIDARGKVKLLKDTKELEKMVDDCKPYLEGTAVQRMLGWVFSGSDFKASEFEHYTEELLAHTLSTYKDIF